MNIKEFKKELSKISGVDFFNPKYREIFKRYFEDKTDDVDDTNDQATADASADSQVVAVDADAVDDAANVQDDNVDDASSEQETTSDVVDDGDGDSESDVDDNTPDKDLPTEEESSQTLVDVGDELLSTKLELELVRAGVREDRMETAKRLFMPEFKASGGNVDEIRELIAKYPEWLGNKGGAQGFGMPLNDKTGVLTNEEKALKQLGIDPRD